MRLFRNMITSPVSSTAGCLAGLPKLIEGIQTHNWVLAIEGFGLILLGIITNEHRKVQQ